MNFKEGGAQKPDKKLEDLIAFLNWFADQSEEKKLQNILSDSGKLGWIQNYFVKTSEFENNKLLDKSKKSPEIYKIFLNQLITFYHQNWKQLEKERFILKDPKNSLSSEESCEEETFHEKFEKLKQAKIKKGDKFNLKYYHWAIIYAKKLKTKSNAFYKNFVTLYSKELAEEFGKFVSSNTTKIRTIKNKKEVKNKKIRPRRLNSTINRINNIYNHFYQKNKTIQDLKESNMRLYNWLLCTFSKKEYNLFLLKNKNYLPEDFFEHSVKIKKTIEEFRTKKLREDFKDLAFDEKFDNLKKTHIDQLPHFDLNNKKFVWAVNYANQLIKDKQSYNDLSKFYGWAYIHEFLEFIAKNTNDSHQKNNIEEFLKSTEGLEDIF